jgi:pimeloyl-ACP methyl ester carboxylesterase
MSPDKRRHPVTEYDVNFHRINEEPQFVNAENGSRLAYSISGAPLDGKSRVVFLLHGSPGSRLGPKPRSIALYRLGITLISYDRPGYGLSEPKEGRTIADAAKDVKAIADAEGIETFSVIGRSGGAPHALACAALMPDRVQKAVALAGLAPRELVPDYYQGMTKDNANMFSLNNRNALIEEYQARAEKISQDTHAHMFILDDLIADALTKTDKDVTDDLDFRHRLMQAYQEGIRNGVDGMVDDAIALANPWGFDVTKISVPVAIWSGTEDKFSPHNHSVALAQAIPGANFEKMEGHAHFSMFNFSQIFTKEIFPLGLSKLFDPTTKDIQRPSTPTPEQLGLAIELPSDINVSKVDREILDDGTGDRNVAAHNVKRVSASGEDSLPDYEVSTVRRHTAELRGPFRESPYETIAFRRVREKEVIRDDDGDIVTIYETGDLVEDLAYSSRLDTKEEAETYHRETVERVVLDLAA